MRNIITLTEKTKRDGTHKAWVYSLGGKVLRTSGRPDPFPFGFLYPKRGQWSFGQKPDSAKVKYQGEPTVYTVVPKAEATTAATPKQDTQKQDTPKLIKPGFENVHQYNAKIGKHGNGGRVCLWTNRLADIGFGSGQCIDVKLIRSTFIKIRKARHGRKVSRVMNKGAYRPVIDLKQTAKIDIAKIGNVGDEVTVTLWRSIFTTDHRANHITITPCA